MSRAWDHAVRPLTADEIDRAIARAATARFAPMPLGWARGSEDWQKWSEREALFLDRCRATATCTALATHETSYRYVTGRRGRTTVAEKRACADHASRFAAKHGLTFAGNAA